VGIGRGGSDFDGKIELFSEAGEGLFFDAVLCNETIYCDGFCLADSVAAGHCLDVAIVRITWGRERYICGLKLESRKITVSAPVRFIPRPPALVLMR